MEHSKTEYSSSPEKPITLNIFNKLPPRQVPRHHATIMLIGMNGVGKRTISKALDELTKNTVLQIRTTSTAPLIEDKTRPRIDFVVFAVDMTSVESFDFLRTTINSSCIHPHYFMSRCCIIASRGESPSLFAFSISELEYIQEMYDIPFFLCNLVDEAMVHDVAKKVFKMVQISNHFVENAISLSPLLTRTADVNIVNSTRLDTF